MTDEQLDQLSLNTIRALSMDAVQQANSGHPGTPMALAPLVSTLWNSVLRFDPQDSIWPNRDRFVLSNGQHVFDVRVFLSELDPNAVRIELCTNGIDGAYIAQTQARYVVYIENTPMFVQIAEGLGIRSILHTDYRSTCAKLAAFGLQNDAGVIHETS